MYCYLPLNSKFMFRTFVPYYIRNMNLFQVHIFTKNVPVSFIRKKMTRTSFWSLFIRSHYLIAASTGIEPVFSPWEGDVLTPWPTGHLFICRSLFAVDSFNIHHLFLKCKYFFKKISIFLFFSNFSFKKPCIYAMSLT